MTTVRLAMKFHEVDEQDIAPLIRDDGVVFEQKMDGTRVLAVITPGNVAWFQSGGKKLTHSAAVQHMPDLEPTLLGLMRGAEGEIVLDGELMIRTGELHIFDLPYLRMSGSGTQSPGVSPTDPYSWRRDILDTLMIGELVGSPVHLVRPAFGPRAKLRLFEAVKAAGAEGVMAKNLDGPYEPGKRVKHTVKIKLVKTADVIVTAVDRPDPKHGNFTFGIDAVQSGVQGDVVVDERFIATLGRCSAIGKPVNVAVGDVIEVAYLYRDATGGLVQPRMVRLRLDKAPADCTLDQFPIYSRDVVNVERF
jgi:ATP-dependent DNA ligase